MKLILLNIFGGYIYSFHQGNQKFADYTIVSKDVKVLSFKLPENALISTICP